MKNDKIETAIDAAFETSFKNWTKKIESELYPSAFANDTSWLAVKNALKINNQFLKAALKESLSELLSE